MMFTPPSRFWASLYVASALIVVSTTIARAQTAEAQPEFDVGDKWTYRFTNKGDRREPYLYTHQTFKSEGGSGWLFLETQQITPPPARKQFIWRYDYKRGDVKEAFEFDPANPVTPGNRFIDRLPQEDWIRFPLAVGKKYSLKFDWNDRQGNTKYDVTVEAFEKVTTEAGVFEAYRISGTGWWQRTVNGNYSGRAANTLWWAPAAKRVVKAENFDRQSNNSPWNENTTELVKWEPKADLPAMLAAPAK